MSILIFVAVPFILVLVHEWGHYITAKMTGMRVDEFGIGFPPKLFGIKRGETEYSINALPIGGFVKIYGEDGVGDPSARPTESVSKAAAAGNNPVSGQFQYGKDEVNDPSLRPEGNTEVTAGGNDYSRSFTGKSKWAQALVLLAGVSMNAIFAWLLFTGAFMMGIEQAVDESAASENARLIVTQVLPEGPAADAEISPGVSITAVTRGGETLEDLTPSAFTAFVGRDAASPVQIAYTKGEELFVANIAPQTGVIESDPNRPAVGVALALVDTVSYPFFEAVSEAFSHTVESTVAITVGLYDLLRDAIFGKADFSQVAGPIGIVGLVGEASAFGFSALLMFTAFISLNLAVINLLPFPALDGGRLVFVGIEALIRRPIPARVTQILNLVGFGMLIILMIVVTWNDIARII